MKGSFLLVAVEAIEVSEATWTPQTRARYQQDRDQHSGVGLWAPLSSEQPQIHHEVMKLLLKRKKNCKVNYFVFLLVTVEAIEVSEATWTPQTRAKHQQDRVQLNEVGPEAPLASDQPQIHPEVSHPQPKRK